MPDVPDVPYILPDETGYPRDVSTDPKPGYAHIEGAYDTVVEIEDSGWVSELLVAEPRETWGRWVIRHFMIFIDSAGCFEVAAESWSLLPEELIG